MRECRECSYVSPPGTEHCPKCDADLMTQSDGTIVTIDIAHHRETVDQAKLKLDRAVNHHRNQLTHSLRVIVGRGKIGRSVSLHLQRLRADGDIVGFALEEGNAGAIIVRLKR